MDMVSLVVDLVIVLWFLAVIVAIVRALQARTPHMVPLSPASRNQFVSSWHRIAAAFVDAPQEAVTQADALVVSLLRERGRPVNQDHLPKPIKDARHVAMRENSIGTEALRLAMLQYRAIFTRAIGRPAETPAPQARRREMA